MTRNNPAEFLISKVLCVHGFRAMFSTIANENGITRDEIERQLQWWSDDLDGLE